MTDTYKALGTTLILWGSIMLGFSDVLLYLDAEISLWGPPNPFCQLLTSNGGLWTAIMLLGVLIWAIIIARTAIDAVKKRNQKDSE